jgi:hypothetical protein
MSYILLYLKDFGHVLRILCFLVCGLNYNFVPIACTAVKTLFDQILVKTLQIMKNTGFTYCLLHLKYLISLQLHCIVPYSSND